MPVQRGAYLDLTRYTGDIPTIAGRRYFFGERAPGGTLALFSSEAPDLVANDTNAIPDIFLANLATGAITRVNTAADGTQANGSSYTVSGSTGRSFSPDGTYVLFSSSATNLMPTPPARGEAVAISGYYARNIATGALIRVDSAANGTPGNDASYIGANPFSPDGTLVLFSSSATNLVSGDTNEAPDLFVKNLATGAITRVNTAADGTQSPYASLGNPAFLPNGTSVLFDTTRPNPAPGDSPWTADIFIKDLATGAITRVNTAADGTPANAGEIINPPRVSADGAFVLFASPASNLVPNDTNEAWDIFRKNLATGAITRVNTAADGTQAIGEPNYLFQFALSSDGTHALFTAEADNLVPGDTSGSWDLFLKNLATGAITRIASPAEATLSDGTPLFPPDALSPSVPSVSFGHNLATGAITRVDTSFAIDPYVIRWANPAQASPGASSFTVTVTRPSPATGPDSIAWSVAGIGPTPADAADFVGNVLPSGTVTFADGEVEQAILLHVANNAPGEPDEGFAIALGEEGVNSRYAPVAGAIRSSTRPDELVVSIGGSEPWAPFPSYRSDGGGVWKQWIHAGPQDVIASVTEPGWLIRTGSGNDAIALLPQPDTFAGSWSILDGGAGSNFLAGGPAHEDFILDARNPAEPSWNSVANFALGDNVALFGIDPADLALDWFDNLGTPGATGLTLVASRAGTIVTALTLAGYATADLENGTLTQAFPTDPASLSPYLHIARS